MVLFIVTKVLCELFPLFDHPFTYNCFAAPRRTVFCWPTKRVRSWISVYNSKREGWGFIFHILFLYPFYQHSRRIFLVFSSLTSWVWVGKLFSEPGWWMEVFHSSRNELKGTINIVCSKIQGGWTITRFHKLQVIVNSSFYVSLVHRIRDTKRQWEWVKSEWWNKAVRSLI